MLARWRGTRLLDIGAGSTEDGNHQALLSIDAWNTNGQLRTVVLRGHDHFSPLAGVNERLAAQIVSGAAWDEVAPAELQEGADAPFVAAEK